MHSSIIPLMSIFTTIEIDDESLAMLFNRLINIEKIISGFCIIAILSGLLICGIIIAILCLKVCCSRFYNYISKSNRIH